jgi:hypothetical protein
MFSLLQSLLYGVKAMLCSENIAPFRVPVTINGLQSTRKNRDIIQTRFYRQIIASGMELHYSIQR